MAFDPKLQRRIMGRFATGVVLVTTQADGAPKGMTANAVVSLSLEPPLVLLAVHQRNHLHACLTASRFFALNVLAQEHQALSRQFARPGPKDFSGVPLMAAVTGAPILSGALAYVDCRVERILPGGDHDIFIGEIVAGGARDGEPLVFYAGQYTQLVVPPPAPSAEADDLESAYDLYAAF